MATLPTPRTWTVGELLTAAKLNTDLRDGLLFLFNPPLCSLQTGSTTQSIANNTTTDIVFSTAASAIELVDSDGMHSLVTNTARVTAVTAGWYKTDGLVAYALNGTGSRSAIIARNGAGQQEAAFHTSATVGIRAPIAAHNFLSVGDYITLQAVQQSGGALSTAAFGSWLNVQWVSKA